MDNYKNSVGTFHGNFLNYGELALMLEIFFYNFPVVWLYVSDIPYLSKFQNIFGLVTHEGALMQKK